MPRVFVALAVANLMCLLATAVLGFFVQGVGRERHVVLSVFTLLLSCLLQVLVFTYFTVSAKVIAQAVHLARLDQGVIRQSRHFKRKVTLSVGGTFATLILVTATGAAAWRTGTFSVTHLISGAVLLAVHMAAWGFQYTWVVDQSRLLAETLEKYNELRRRRA